MNRPRDVLMQACIEDLIPVAEKLRQMGWPVEIVAVNQAGDFYGARLQIPLDAMPVPLGATG